MNESGAGNDQVRLDIGTGLTEVLGWHPTWQCDKFNQDIDGWVEDLLSGESRRVFADVRREGLVDDLLFGNGDGIRPVLARVDCDLPNLVYTRQKVHDGRALFHRLEKRDDIVVVEGNQLTTAGVNSLLLILNGGGGSNPNQYFNNANAYIGAGDSSTAEQYTDTDLLAATNKLRKAMNSTYPTTPSARTTVYQSTFASGDLSGIAFNEVGLFNASAAQTMLNRKVVSLGTKGAGATWTISLSVVLN